MAGLSFNFQYCQKLILFSEDWTAVFLARRYGEADYDGTFSFIGGKMDTSDEGLLAGLKREKQEEIGPEAHVEVHLGATHNLFFRKKDGSAMILPHYIARCTGGEIQLNHEEYSEYRWVPLAELTVLEPKIENIPSLVDWALRLKQHLQPTDYTPIH